MTTRQFQVCVLTICAVLTSALLSKKYFLAVETEEPVQKWEDGMRTAGEEEAFEWWYFDGKLDDGTLFVIIWHTAYPPETSSISVAFTPPDEETFLKRYSFPPDQFQGSRESCFVKIGNNVLEGDLNNYRQHFELEDLKGDLYLERTAPSWRPRNNIRYYTGARGKYFAWLPAVPAGKIHGKISFKGEEKEVSGIGYHDHNWANMSWVQLETIIGKRYWGRVIAQDYAIVFSQVVFQKKIGSPASNKFYLAQGDKILIDHSADHSPSFSLEEKTYTDHPSNSQEKLPELTIRYNDNISLSIKLKSERMLLPFYDNKYLRYAGIADVELTTPEGSKNFRGDCLWEFADYTGQ
ncbi:MAG: hypothetical protein FJZ04_01675 [Candidatus Moranbacteria bacterium]|nr:hypothetical protein [Candidatus Moranbacteria bacterium]